MLKSSKYFSSKIDDNSKFKTIIIAEFNINHNDSDILVKKLDLNSSQIKIENNCENLNFPAKLNKENIKVISLNSPHSSKTSTIGTTLKSTIKYNNSVIASNSWLDQNKLTTILIFLIMIIVILMVCIGLKIFMPRSFFRKFYV